MSDISVSDGGRSSRGKSVGSILGGGITTLGDAVGITRGAIQIGQGIQKVFAETAQLILLSLLPPTHFVTIPTRPRFCFYPCPDPQGWRGLH